MILILQKNHLSVLWWLWQWVWCRLEESRVWGGGCKGGGGNGGGGGGIDPRQSKPSHSLGFSSNRLFSTYIVCVYDSAHVTWAKPLTRRQELFKNT